MPRPILPFLLGAALAACSAEPEPEPVEGADPVAPPVAVAGPTGTPAGVPLASASAVLTLEGLGDLRLGRPVPEGGRWAERGAQIPGPCRTISSPDYPGVYAIVEDGAVRRITLGERSSVNLAEGLGVGASEDEVLAWFPFESEPHQYVGPPGKYLTAPNAASGNPALRFEIGADGRVSLIHVGTMPVLAYPEGCA